MKNTQLHTEIAHKYINTNLVNIQKSSGEKHKNWLAENQQALAAYNQRIRERGVFSDGMRTF